MPVMPMRTFTARPADVKREWILIDAAGQTLGRIATKIATLLLGKHKATFERHINMGDSVVVINAKHVKVTGKKEKNKIYYHHTGYPGGIKAASVEEMRKKHPERIIEMAVKRMLPKRALGNDIYRQLWVYPEAEHPHQAQQPRELIINTKAE